MDDEHSEIRIVASEEEHKLITTNADELLEQNSNKDEQSESKIHSKKQKKDMSTEKVSQPLGEKKLSVRIAVDENRTLYKHKDLKLEDIKYLIRKGFKETAQIGITSSKKEKYLIKPRFNESISHAFLCYDIAEYLKKFTNNVKLLQTKEADIIFTINNKKYAIEIETGTVLKRDRKKLIEKIKDLNKKYKDNWFFVVTDRNLFPKYNKFGETYTKKSVANKILGVINNDEK